MKILLTGVSGYIGKRLLPVLLEAGHDVYCLVRLQGRQLNIQHPRCHIITVDLLKEKELQKIPDEIQVAYYLVHSMSDSREHFESLEEKAAAHFAQRIQETQAKQIIYLSGLANHPRLSKHILSRVNVEKILKKSQVPVTILRAGIIIGSGSASFEIIRDLVEKLPVLTVPKWIHNQCQPIAIHNVIHYLTHVVLHPKCLNQTFDIGGPEILSFRRMMSKLAKFRGLRRFIITFPFIQLHISAYWVYLMTSVNDSLAKYLVDSMKQDFICQDHRIRQILPQELFNFETAIQRAFQRIAQNEVISSWKDSWPNIKADTHLKHYIEVPVFGCLNNQQVRNVQANTAPLIKTIWSIGGDQGWYYMSWVWSFRGLIDKCLGGVGLRRGRTHPHQIVNGDCLDFWRVILADEEDGRLLLYAEMKVPGEAWLEFSIQKKGKQVQYHQIATFRPQGILGRIYWYLLFPIHWLIFRGMANEIVRASTRQS